MPRTECLTEADLTALVLGELPDGVLDEYVEHLEGCPHCEAVARQLDDLTDSAIRALRRSPSARGAPCAGQGGSPAADGEQPPEPRGDFVDPQRTLPDRIGDYEILGEVGRGGMGVVYKARQTSLRRTVALKMMLRGRFADSPSRARFRSEAEAIARLQHPHIVQIFEIGEVEGQPYFTLEFVDGGNLEQLAGQPQPARQAARWLDALARAVHYAHQQGIVHRDLKPENVLFTQRGQLKITDFGVAKLLEGSDMKTATGLIIGTAEYMAPEQADARPEVGPSADVYALGAILYTLLTGRPPFQSASVLATLEQVKTQEPVPLRHLQPQLPRDLETICLKCLQKEPRNRYPTSEALADDLHRFLEGRPIQARPLGPGVRLWRWCRRNPVVATLTAAVATLLLVVAAGALLEMRQAQQRAEAETQAREDLERQLYRTYIALAERECSADNMRRVDQLLDACRSDLRGWEWHYLKRRRYQQDVRLGSPANARLHSVAFSPDGRFLAVTAPGLDLPRQPGTIFRDLIPNPQDGTVTLWDLTTGRQVRTFQGHEDRPVWSVVFSPDGQRLASASGDQTVKLWDVMNGRELRTLRGHSEPVIGVAFAPDGRSLASASQDWSVKIWDAKTGQNTSTLRGHTGGVRAVAFSPDGRSLASTSDDRTVKLWDVASGQEILTLRGHSSKVYEGAFSPDSRRLASASADGTVKLWEVTTGQELLTLRGHIDEVKTVAFSPDGERLASGGSDRTLRLWDARTGKEAITLHGHADTVSSVGFSPDGHRLVSAGWGGRVFLWDATPMTEAPAQEALTLRGHTDAVLGVAFSRDGLYLASASLDRTVKVWDRATGQEIHSLGGFTRPVLSAAFSPDGRRLASLGGEESLVLWDLSTGQRVSTLQAHSRWGTCVVFSRDGKFLATASRDGTAKLWNAATGQVLQVFQGRTSWVNGVAISPDGLRLATANDDGTVQVWDTSTGKEVHILGRHTLPVTSVAFSPDGKWLASSSRDETVRIWDLAKGHLISALRGHTERVFHVAISPDGKRLASVGADETVRLWNATTGQPVGVLRGHTNLVSSVAFSPDGRWLATGSRDRTIKIWRTGLRASPDRIPGSP